MRFDTQKIIFMKLISEVYRKNFVFFDFFVLKNEN